MMENLYMDNKLTVIPVTELLENCQKLKNEGYHIMQICAVRTADGYELTYSFALEYEMVNLRLISATDEEIMSISNIFSPAFLYENEISELFGVKIQMINLDYKGNLYRIATKTPFKD
jgi:ech hydrogenase subunit D